MNYLGPLGRVFGGLKGLYSGINGATLTGAIDVIVVEQEDGSFRCSPFHVRFGKLGVLRSREKVVDIEVNGVSVPIRMKLGESGEAFFVQELQDEDDDYDENLVTSPLPGTSPQYDPSEAMRKGLEQSMAEEAAALVEDTSLLDKAIAGSGTSVDDPKKKRRRRKRRNQNGSKSDIVVNPLTPTAEATQQPDQIFNMDEDYVNHALKELQVTSSTPVPVPSSTLTHSRSFHRDFYSDTEADLQTPSRPSTPIQSDSEYEINKVNTIGGGIRFGEDEAEVSKWAWGQLPVSSAATTPTAPQPVIDQKTPTPAHGLAPSDEELRHRSRSGSDARSMLSGMFRFMKRNPPDGENDAPGIYLDDLNLETMDREQAALYFPNYRDDTSPRRPHSDDDVESGKGSSLPQSPQPGSSPKSQPQSHLDFMMEQERRQRQPQSHASCSPSNNFEAISLCGQNLSLFDQSQLTYDELVENPDLILQAPPESIVVKVDGKILPWPAVLPQLMSNTFFGRPLPSHVQQRLMEQYVKKDPSQPQPSQSPPTAPGTQANRKSFWFPWRRSHQNSSNSSEMDLLPGESLRGLKGSSSSSDESEMVPRVPSRSQLHTVINISTTPAAEKYKKSLRLTSEQIESLQLHPGQNEVVFSVTTAYQGTSVARCHIYLWRYDDRVVISDIDGTITKSDVLGHVLPMIGTDWAQSGVAQLFTQIQNNGYKLLYLSARAIGQAQTTREYLRSIRQGDVTLPDGPLLLNPTSLMSALHREVIEKKPEEFKIACLRDVQQLFPSNPFYAGYGNRINDVWAYRAVDVPISRIFTINHKGELRHALTNTFQSSYTSLVELAEHIFPAYRLRSLDTTAPDGFSNFEFWREPIAVVSTATIALPNQPHNNTQQEATAPAKP